MAKQTVYTVTAIRFGHPELHAYVVGVYGKKHAALKCAEDEEVHRGGKYVCEVLEWELGQALNHETGHPKVVKGLPRRA